MTPSFNPRREPGDWVLIDVELIVCASGILRVALFQHRHGKGWFRAIHMPDCPGVSFLLRLSAQQVAPARFFADPDEYVAHCREVFRRVLRRRRASHRGGVRRSIFGLETHPIGSTGGGGAQLTTPFDPTHAWDDWDLVACEEIVCAAGRLELRLYQHQDDGRWFRSVQMPDCPGVCFVLRTGLDRAAVAGLFTNPDAHVTVFRQLYGERFGDTEL